MLRRPISAKWHFLLGAASILLLGLIYTYFSHQRRLEDPKDKIMPSWEQFWEEGLLRAITPEKEIHYDRETGERTVRVKEPIRIPLWEDFKATFERLFWGMFYSIVVSLVVGLLMGCYAPIEAFLMPPLAFLAKIPGTAMMTIFFVLVGLNFKLYVAMIVFGIVPTLTQTIYHAAKEDVPEELLFKARTLGATQASCIWDVIFKHILPKFLEAVRLSVGPAIIFLYAAEYIYGTDGLGCRIRLTFKAGAEGSPITYFYLICIGAFGYLIDLSLRQLQRFLCPWYAGK